MAPEAPAVVGPARPAARVEPFMPAAKLVSAELPKAEPSEAMPPAMVDVMPPVKAL
ncbi:hypothetical protein D3C72_2302870 [compost metagenome]